MTVRTILDLPGINIRYIESKPGERDFERYGSPAYVIEANISENLIGTGSGSTLEDALRECQERYEESKTVKDKLLKKVERYGFGEDFWFGRDRELLSLE